MPPPPPPPAMRPAPPPPAMPPPPSASASALATLFATHWIVDALAGDESIDFAVLQALLEASSDALAGAPEATRERVALRSLQVLSPHIPAAGDAAAMAGVIRVDAAWSGEEVLSRFFREVELTRILEKDLLPPFSQDVLEIIRTKKLTLPETSFQLLKAIDAWMLQPCMPESSSYVPPQEDTMDAVGLGARSPERSPIVEGSMSVGSVLASASCAAPLQGMMSEPFSQQDKHDTTAAVEPKSCVEKSPNPPHCANGEGADDGGSSNHEGLSAHATVTPGFDRIRPTDASESGHLPGGITAQDTTRISQQPDSRKARLSALQHERGALDGDGSIMNNNTTHGGLTAQTAPVSQNCNVFLHDKTSEANRADVQKDNCRTSIPSSSNDRDRESAKKTSNEEKSEDTSPEISVRSKDDIADTLEGLSQQDLCIRCGKDGELLTCSDCSLAAHDSCFGPSVTFEETDLFYCPVCSCKKAKELYLKSEKTYLEAMKDVAAYLGTARVSKQHDEQLNGVQPGAAKRDAHSNGSKRNSVHQNEAYDLAHQDEEPHQPRKKQKTDARGNGYPNEVLTEKVPIQDSGHASMNEHSVLQTNSKTRVEGPEKKQQAGDKEACKEAGNDNLSHETAASSQRGCDPTLNQDSEANQEDSLTASKQSGGKRSSPPWRNMMHEKESAVPGKSRKGTAKQGQRRKRGSVHPQKRYSNPVGPPGRRTKLGWTKAEEAMLKEAMSKYTPQDGAPFPWAKMLVYGCGVFNKTRMPLDLRDKWRNLKKAGKW